MELLEKDNFIELKEIGFNQHQLNLCIKDIIEMIF